MISKDIEFYEKRTEVTARDMMRSSWLPEEIVNYMQSRIRLSDRMREYNEKEETDA